MLSTKKKDKLNEQNSDLRSALRPGSGSGGGTFVITDREVGLPSSLLCQAEEEPMSSQRLVGVCGADGLDPLGREPQH